MTDPNDDLSSIADPGSFEPDGSTALPAENQPASEDGPGVPGGEPDSQATQGSPLGPPD